MDPVGASLLDHARAELQALGRVLTDYEREIDRLRAALDLIANWSSRTAEEHGHVGVREFARQVIDPSHPLGFDGPRGVDDE